MIDKERLLLQAKTLGDAIITLNKLNKIMQQNFVEFLDGFGEMSQALIAAHTELEALKKESTPVDKKDEQGLAELALAEMDKNLYLAMVENQQDLQVKIKFLLDGWHLWSEDGAFTFPDGDTWHRDET